MKTPLDRVTMRRLFGETIREVGILVAVFGPLDAILRDDRPARTFVAVTGALGLSCMAIGIIIESMKDKDLR